jgi:lipopolysaccharide/colanic/teichoic acid biosynthesis glycosyltransferase
MSLVGPRAHPVHMKIEGHYYADAVKNYHYRHRLRPGITGWAQINGSRGRIENIPNAERRLELDMFYMQNLSLMLDFYIILRTICGGFLATEERYGNHE